jgi:hypothetical protein
MARTHKDVEFAVDDASGRERVFKTWDEAAGFAVSIATSGRPSAIDILVYSEAGARNVMGEDGVAMYREDPDASVFWRIEIIANAVGRVP